ncbi:MAG: L-2-amino-thiazoline-4-carboxylic acid hydrolase [Myxococcales bacterium]|nr:L-2-amino-thiazoline-4-carboxylic acid hydrolase [Myxococcales bacterium]
MTRAANKPLHHLLADGREALARALGDPAIEAFTAQVWARYAALETQAPRFRQRINRGLFKLGLPALAIYRALQDDQGLARDAALELVEEVLTTRYHAIFGRSPLRARIMSQAVRLPLVRRRMLHAIERLDEPDGFRMRRVESDDLMAFDVHECALVKYFAREGVPELGPLICKLDDLIAGYMDGVTLERGGTIAGGASRCDFRYRRE